MKQLLFILFFLFGYLTLQAQTIKGLPADFPASELLIVAYEPADMIPADAKSHESIYRQLTPLQTQCNEANQQLATIAKSKYPFRYRLIRKGELAHKYAENIYIFEPAKLYSQLTVWSTTPLYIRHAASGLVYEIGFMPTSAIFQADEIMEHLIQFLPKNLPLQTSEKIAVKQLGN